MSAPGGAVGTVNHAGMLLVTLCVVWLLYEALQAMLEEAPEDVRDVRVIRLDRAKLQPRRTSWVDVWIVVAFVALAAFIAGFWACEILRVWSRP